MKLMHTFIIVKKTNHILFVSKMHVDLIKRKKNKVHKIDI